MRTESIPLIIQVAHKDDFPHMSRLVIPDWPLLLALKQQVNARVSLAIMASCKQTRLIDTRSFSPLQLRAGGTARRSPAYDVKDL